MYSIFIITCFRESVNRCPMAQILIKYEILLDFFDKIRYDECIFERQWRCTVAFRFLSERGSHRLKASLSSNEMSNFPPELFVQNLFHVRDFEGRFRTLESDMMRRVVRNVVRVKQMRVRAVGSGSWVVPRILFVPCMETCRGFFFFVIRFQNLCVFLNVRKGKTKQNFKREP